MAIVTSHTLFNRYNIVLSNGKIIKYFQEKGLKRTTYWTNNENESIYLDENEREEIKNAVKSFETDRKKNYVKAQTRSDMIQMKRDLMLIRDKLSNKTGLALTMAQAKTIFNSEKFRRCYNTRRTFDECINTALDLLSILITGKEWDENKDDLVSFQEKAEKLGFKTAKD